MRYLRGVKPVARSFLQQKQQHQRQEQKGAAGAGGDAVASSFAGLADGMGWEEREEERVLFCNNVTVALCGRDPVTGERVEQQQQEGDEAGSDDADQGLGRGLVVEVMQDGEGGRYLDMLFEVMDPVHLLHMLWAIEGYERGRVL